MMQRWDVYRAYVKREDSPQKDHRPILIINVEPSAFLCMKITKNISRPEPWEYKIINWQEAGLDVPSCVRLKKKIKFNSFKDIVHIGKLSKLDIDNIKELCKRFKIDLTK